MLQCTNFGALTDHGSNEHSSSGVILEHGPGSSKVGLRCLVLLTLGGPRKIFGVPENCPDKPETSADPTPSEGIGAEIVGTPTLTLHTSVTEWCGYYPNTHKRNRDLVRVQIWLTGARIGSPQ